LIFKKFIFLFTSMFFLNSCIETTAFLGPAVTVGTTGNIYQAGFTYSSNYVVKETTGKTPSEHILQFIDSKRFEDTKKKITNTKKKLEDSIQNFESNSVDFYSSVKRVYLQEKN